MDILRAAVVDTKKARVMVSSNATTMTTAVPEGVPVKSHTVVISRMGLGAMRVKGMDASINQRMTTTTRMGDKNMVAQKDAPDVTTMMTAVATIARIKITLPRTPKLRKLDTVRVPSITAVMATTTDVVHETRKVARALVLAQKVIVVVTKANAWKVMSRVIIVAARAITLATAGTKPMVRSASIFATMTVMRIITAGRSTITVARTRTIEYRTAREIFFNPGNKE